MYLLLLSNFFLVVKDVYSELNLSLHSPVGWLCHIFLMLFKRFASTSTGTLPLTIRQILASGQDSASKVHDIHGWIKSVRRQKNVTFAVVNDGSCASGLQTVLNNSLNANFHGYVCSP